MDEFGKCCVKWKISYKKLDDYIEWFYLWKCLGEIVLESYRVLKISGCSGLKEVSLRGKV